MAKRHFTRIVYVLLLLGCSAANAGWIGEIGVSFIERPKGSLWQQSFAGYYTEWDTHPIALRLGYEHSVTSVGNVDLSTIFSAFDLGKYSIKAEAADDEGAVELCHCKVDGDTDMYFTTGHMRGFALSLRSKWRNFYVEVGPAYFEYAFKVEKDDGFRFAETVHGFGHMIGGGFEYKNFTIGLYFYRTKIGGSFDGGDKPSGTGGANVIAGGYKF